jgi:hypothetical protein
MSAFSHVLTPLTVPKAPLEPGDMSDRISFSLQPVAAAN